MYDHLVEKIECEVDNLRNWTKIIDDGAFVDIIDGWKVSNRRAYTDYLKKKNVVVQAGGYCGIHPRLFSQIFETVYTFEPDPLNFFCLTQNCQTDNVVKCQGALGFTNNLVSVIRSHPNNYGMNRVLENTQAWIPQYNIDALNLYECDLIQLDTEGYEYNILLGARDTIEKFHPVVSVEDTTRNIEDFLFHFGYKKRVESYRDTVYSVD